LNDNTWDARVGLEIAEKMLADLFTKGLKIWGQLLTSRYWTHNTTTYVASAEQTSQRHRQQQQQQQQQQRHMLQMESLILMGGESDDSSDNGDAWQPWKKTGKNVPLTRLKEHCDKHLRGMCLQYCKSSDPDRVIHLADKAEHAQLYSQFTSITRELALAYGENKNLTFTEFWEGVFSDPVGKG
jgi:hypothetical protein